MVTHFREYKVDIKKLFIAVFGQDIFDAFNKILGKYKKPEGLPPNSILDGFDGHVVKVGGKSWAVKKDGDKAENVL